MLDEAFVAAGLAAGLLVVLSRPIQAVERSNGKWLMASVRSNGDEV
jgi:hypothetical protein